MALLHEFILLSTDKESPNYYKTVQWNETGNIEKGKTGIEEVVEIPHEVIQYMEDSLTWVRSIDPLSKEEIDGLNYYGYSIIKQEHAEKMYRLFKSWTSILSLSEEKIELTGSFVLMGEDGAYEKIIVERDKTIEQLTELVSYLKKVSENKEYHILHCGL